MSTSKASEASISSFHQTPVPPQPDWDELIKLGFPLSTENMSGIVDHFDSTLFFHQINRSLDFLSFHNETAEFQRHRDAMKGFILALKTHYNTLFQQINHPFANSLAQESVQGRDIKLRNIALERVARYV